MSAAPTLAELVVGDEPAAWRRLGFAVDGDRLAVGATRVRLAGPGAGRGIVGWALRNLATTALDGLPTTRSREGPPAPAAHLNGALAVDHVVVSTPDFPRTVAALQAAGIALRREREVDALRPMRMGFFRIGEALLELVEHPEAPDRAAPASFGGLVIGVGDLDGAGGLLGDALGDVHDAVQPGRRIATVKRATGVSPAVALMTPARP